MKYIKIAAGLTHVNYGRIREISEQWLEEYNAIRPHEAFQGLPPYQYA